MPSVISPLACISKHAIIGRGTIVMHGVIVNAGAIIGDNCIINTYSLVEYDIIIGDYTHIFAQVAINVGRAVIGSRSVIKDNINIEEPSIIGAGIYIKKT
jgi:UDP-3-O-[3-hydroxymyristoyl] glucosamine N-acyltransferase